MEFHLSSTSRFFIYHLINEKSTSRINEISYAVENAFINQSTYSTIYKDDEAQFTQFTKHMNKSWTINSH